MTLLHRPRGVSEGEMGVLNGLLQRLCVCVCVFCKVDL